MAKAPAAKAGAGAATASTIKAAIARPRAVLNESTIPLPNVVSAPNLKQRSFQLGECVVEIGRNGDTSSAAVRRRAAAHRHDNNGRWLWAPAFAGATEIATPAAPFPTPAACRCRGTRFRR